MTDETNGADPDGLATPAEPDQPGRGLPPATSYVVVPGAGHDVFGDYAVQPAAGTQTADRAAAQIEITKATRAVLAAVTPKPKKK